MFIRLPMAGIDAEDIFLHKKTCFHIETGLYET